MRPIQSVLLPLVFLTASIATAAAQNVCVHGADGAIVCGPVAPGAGARPGGDGPNPWDKPAQNFRPGDRPGPFVDRRAPPRRAVREAERHAPPRHAYREPPPPPQRDFERRPPPRQIAREDARRYAERRYRQPPPPPQGNRMHTARYPEGYPDMQQRRYDDGPGRAGMIDPRYEARLRELEREIRELRGEHYRYLPPSRPPRHNDRYTAND